MKKIILIIFIILIVFVLALRAYAPSFISSYVSREAKIIFVGDLFFDRHIRKVMAEKGKDYPLSCINDFLDRADLVVGNLEGPITYNPSVSLGSTIGSSENYVFTFPPEVAKLLKNNNVQLVSLGNNHISNFGEEGIASTREYLDEAGVNYFGGIAGGEPIYRTRLAGTKVSFISYNQFGGSSAANVAEEIKTEKEAGNTVIVFAHWGEEYALPTPGVKEAAQLFAQSGASLIVGAHPHVVLPSEKIGSTSVYYSLGNFIFDQYWDQFVSTGLALEVDLKNDAFTFTEHLVTLSYDGRTCLK